MENECVRKADPGHSSGVFHRLPSRLMGFRCVVDWYVSTDA
jgi:hypothetical protein